MILLIAICIIPNTQNFFQFDNQSVSTKSTPSPIDELMRPTHNLQGESNESIVTPFTSVNENIKTYNYNSLSTITMSTNITNKILKSDYTVQLSFTNPIYKISYRFGGIDSMNTTLTMYSKLYNISVPTADPLIKLTDFLYINIFNGSDYIIDSKSVAYTINNAYVNVIYIDGASKLLPSKQLAITFDQSFAGLNWKWNKDGISNPTYTANNIITTPSIDGTYTLNILINNLRGENQNVLTYNYIIDGTAPPLTPALDINNFIPSGSIIPFINSSVLIDGDKKFFNFTWVGSGVYTTEFPVIPAHSGTHILNAVVKDELGNRRENNFTIHAMIGIVNVFPDKAGRPGEAMNITFSEAPDIVSYGYYFSNNTLYYSNTTVPYLPVRVGDYYLKINAKDILGNWLNTTYSIRVDNTPLTFISINPGNNSVLYDNSEIVTTFDEIPSFLIYAFNSSYNMTGNIYLPNYSGKFNLTVYAGDLARNWITLHFVFSRFYRPVLNPANNSYIYPDTIINATLDFPYNNITISWDYNSTNSTFSIPPFLKSGLHNLSIILKYNNVVSISNYTYIIKIKILNITINPRMMANVPIFLSFSEQNVVYSYKYDNSISWYFINLKTPSVEGYHTLYINMNSFDNKYSFIESFYFLVDKTPPSVSSISPFTSQTPSTVTSNSKVNVSISDSNCLSSCFTYLNYTWNNGAYTYLNVSQYQNPSTSFFLTTIPFNTSPSNLMNLTILLTDTAGNILNKTYVYRIDNFAPTIIVNRQIDNHQDIVLPVTLVFNFSEFTKSKFTFYYYNTTYNFTKTDNYIGNSTFITDFYGNYSIDLSIIAIDNYGNSMTYNYSFNIIDPAPIIKQIDQFEKIHGGELFNFSVNKYLVSEKIIYLLDNSTSFSYNHLNSTVPRFNNYEGFLNVTFSGIDLQGSIYSKTLIFNYDTKIPSFLTTYQTFEMQGNDTILKEVTSDSYQLDNVIAPQMINLTVIDMSNLTTGNITITYYTNNGSEEVYYKLDNSKMLNIFRVKLVF